MTVAIDRKFINRLSGRVELFKNKGNDLYNFRCTICGDSQTSKSKARGYIFRKGESFRYKCHNCNASLSFKKFLETLDLTLYNQYVTETFSSKFDKNAEDDVPPVLISKIDKTSVLSEVYKNSTKLVDLPDQHYAKKYVVGRQIPEWAYKYFVFTEDFAALASVVNKARSEKLPEKEARLVILHFSDKNELLAIQGRHFKEDMNFKYIVVKVADDVSKLFGLDRNLLEEVYVVEGPIDSLFLPSTIATSDSDLIKASSYVHRDRLVLVNDNQPRNKDIIRQIKKEIELGYRVVIWPSSWEYKDINEAIKAGHDSNMIHRLIIENTYQGLQAQAKLSEWSKSYI